MGQKYETELDVGGLTFVGKRVLERRKILKWKQ